MGGYLDIKILSNIANDNCRNFFFYVEVVLERGVNSMSKDWTNIVKEKMDSFRVRKKEIEDCLKNLKEELSQKQDYIKMTNKLVDDQKLIWEITVGDQKFNITEKEIAENQIITTNNYGESIEAGEKKKVKKVLENLIINKLNSF